MDEIIKSFTNLTPMLWVSQIAGFIGLITIGIAYLFSKKKYLGFACIAFIFFILESTFAGLYSNLIVCGVCLVRNILMFILLCKYNKELPHYLVIMLLIVMWIGVVLYMAFSNTFDVWDNYLPPAIVTMSTITQNNKNDYVVKVGSIAHETGFLIYYLVYALPLSIIRQGILIITALIGLGILIYRSINKKKENNDNINIE